LIVSDRLRWRCQWWTRSAARPLIPKAVNMISGRRSLTRLSLLAGILLTASPGSLVSAPQASPALLNQPMARYDALRPPEVRLRKLHLVRPDLIPYPIEYEVVC